MSGFSRTFYCLVGSRPIEISRSILRKMVLFCSRFRRPSALGVLLRKVIHSGRNIFTMLR